MYNANPYQSISNIIIRSYGASYSGGFASFNESHPDYSSLEAVITQEPTIEYSSQTKSSKTKIYNLDKGITEYILDSYHHDINEQDLHTGFLKPNRRPQKFINCSEDILSYVTETFRAVTNDEFPKDISISVLPSEKFKQAQHTLHGKISDNVLGFAINERKEVFVKENDLDILLIVLGHEIGHVISPALLDKTDEEAKAFAFEMAWISALEKHNIAGLKGTINIEGINPAKNGLHDIAFGFVKSLLNRGFEAFDAFKMLSEKILTTKKESLVYFNNVYFDNYLF